MAESALNRERFRPLQSLGVGGMGQVLLAEDRERGERVALKFLLAPLDPAGNAFFREEVKLLSQLSHPHLIRIFDFFDGGAASEGLPAGPFFSMEYVSGSPLQEAGKQISASGWIDLTAQLCQGLSYLHTRNVLHRDLKPSNILIEADGTPRILDFGLSTPLTRDRPAAKAVGTLVYMPPEAFLGDYGATGDLFALGVLLYECLARRFPFSRPFYPPGQPVDPPAPLKNFRPDLPDFFCDLVHRLLELSPYRRPPSAASVLRYLNQHVELPYPILEEAGTAEVLRKVRLVGRDAELAKLLGCQQRSRRESRPLMLRLEGPTGVGRSRLLEEAKWKFQIEGVSYAAVNADEAAAWPARCLARWGNPSEATDRVGQMKDLLSWAEEKASVLVLEDSHAWPEDVRDELKVFFSLAEDSRARLLVVVEANSDIPAPLPPKDFTNPEVAAEALVLRDLAAQASRELLKAAAPDHELSETLAGEIVAVSGGRPLLLLESLRYVLSRPGETIDPSDLQVQSGNLQAITARRLAALSGNARRLLALMAVHAHPVSPTLAERLYRDGSENFESAFLELYRMGILAGRDAESPDLRLAQTSLRSAYRDALPPEILREARRSWVFVLAVQAGGPAPGPETVWLAEHALAAGDEAALRRFGLAAADYLSEHGAEAESVSWYRTLLTHARTPEERYVLNGSQAPVLYRLGRFEEALEAYDRWFEDRTDDESLLQKTKHRFFTGLVLFAAGREDEARARFEETLAISDSGKFPDLRFYHTRALAFLAASDEKRHDFESAKRRLETALSLAAGSPLLLGEIEQRLGKVEQRGFRYEAALGHYRASWEEYRRAGNAQAEAVALQSLALLELDRGNLAEALRTINQGVDLSKKSGQVLQGARADVNRSLVFSAIGDHGKALACLETGRRIIAVLGNEETRLLTDVHRADLYLRLGNLHRCDRVFQELLSHEPALRRLGLWATVLMRKAEGFYLYGKILPAEEAFTAALELIPPADRAARWEALLGLCRCLARRGKLRAAGSVVQAATAALSGASGKLFTAWRLILAWLAGPADASAAPDFRALVAAVKSLEGAEVRMDMYRLLALDMKRSGMPDSFRRLSALYRQEWEFIHRNLPEELKMDFEKNRRPESLDQSFSDMLAGTPDAPPPVLPESSAPDAAGGISDLRFRQYCEINRQIAQKLDLKDVLERVMDAALELTGAERGFLILKNEQAREKPLVGYEIKAARGLNHRSLQQDDFKFSMSAVQQAMEQGTSLLTSDAQSDDRLQSKKSVVLYQLKAILAVPLEFEGHVQGAIYLDHRSRPGCFNQESVALIGALSVQASIAIQKARMIDDLQKSNRELDLEVKTLSAELSQVREQLRYGYEEIVGKSPALMEVFQLLDHVTDTAIPVWILGESGTGKELIARSLHYNSPRKAGPYVSENCSAIPETLLESELFGHKKGAFTHADRDRIGLFEQADGGTLFLDEVADMSLAMQAKLLRVLQEGEVRPVGSGKKVKVDVRLVTASNRDLEQLVQEGKFRQDLFYRINGMTIPLPPLRERREDIPLLVSHLVEKISRDFKLKPSELSDDAYRLLLEHAWPGNIRELEAVVRNALLFSKGRTVTPEVLSLTKSFKVSAKASASPAAPPSPNRRSEQEEERQMIIDALRRNKMNKRLAAEEMGVSLRSLYFRMERHGIPKNKPVLAKFLGM